MRKSNSQFLTKFLSESGFDKQNGCYYGFVELDKYYCVAVAEGYDDEGGSESARLAVDTAIDAFVGSPGMSSGKLRSCLRRAHKNLVEQSARIRLKAGILLFVSDYVRCRYAFCGSVTLYHLRGGSIVHQSMTHTVYQTAPEYRDPPRETRNLYYYLGGNAGITVSSKIKLKDDDQILMATERFWNRVSRVEVLDAFESFQTQEDFLGDLQELYLRGSTEYIGSYALAAVGVNKVYRENSRLRKKLLLGLLLLAVTVAVGLTVYYFTGRQKKIKQQKIYDVLVTYEEAGDGYLTGLNYQLASQQYEKAIETGAGLSDSEKQLTVEKGLTDKSSISTDMKQAEEAYENMEFDKANQLYRRILKQLAVFPELAGLEPVINRKIELAQYGMEINTYMESGAMKEAAGDMEDAETLYSRAESMLRIVNYPELLKEVQLSLLRVREQEESEGKQAAAGERDQVILEADGQAALEAVLAEDYDTAIALYTQIRDGYAALEYNDKAKEISMLLTLLQKQAQTAQQAELSKGIYAERLELLQQEALNALLHQDLDLAIDKYDQIIQICIAGGNTEVAGQAESAIEYLKQQREGAAANGQ